MNSVHKVARSKPLLFLMKTINDWNMSKFTIRKNKATQWIDNDQQLTDYALDKHNKSMEEASWRNVSFAQWNADHCEVIGNVSKVSSNFSAVDISINVFDKNIGYDCRFMQETGMLCVHAMEYEEEIHVNVTDWYLHRYHAQHYLNCYSLSLSSLAIDRRLNVTESVPSEHKVTAGRPRNKRYVSSSNKERAKLVRRKATIRQLGFSELKVFRTEGFFRL